MVKITVEIADDDVKLIEEIMHIDVSKLVRGLGVSICECYKQLALASRSGIKIEPAKAKEYADKIGEGLVKMVYKYAEKGK